MLKFLHDTRVLFIAHMRNSLRNVVWVVVGMFQPICYLLLFAPLLDNLTRVPGFPSGGTYNVFAPGMLIMVTIFGAGNAGFNLVIAMREGIVERWRVTPANRLALALSMVLRDVLMLLVQSVLLMGMALILGMRPDWLGLLPLLPLVILTGITMASFSYGITLVVKDQGALAALVSFIAVPLLLLSGITLPLSLAPATIQNISKVNPFAYGVDAARALVNGNMSDASILEAFIIFAVLAVLTLFWATRSMRKATL
jgi:ABC-2 type transport system permease protein